MNRQKLNIKDKIRIRRDNTPGTISTVSKLRRNHKGSLAADLHSGNTFIPARNYLADTEGKSKRLSAID